MFSQQAAYGLSPNIMQLAGLQGGTGNPLLDMYSQYAAAYSPQVGLQLSFHSSIETVCMGGIQLQVHTDMYSQYAAAYSPQVGLHC